MSEVEISVPAIIPPTIPLVVVKTLPEGYASYGLDTERKDWIGIDRATGELKLGSYKVFNDLATPTRTGKLSLQVVSRDGVHLMSVNLTPVAATKCSEMHAEDLCFWRAVKLQVYENQPTTVLGPLGPQFVRRICPEHYSISYNITNGTEYASLTEDGLSLQSRERLDRDTRPDGNGTMGPGSEFRVHVSCVLDRGLSLPEEVSLIIPVSVLDEDDNPPVPQESSIRVTLNDSEIKEGELLPVNIFLRDPDTEAVNTFETAVLEDQEHLFRPNCNTYPHDREEPHSTVIRCLVKARKTSVLPSSSYKMVLRVNDTTLKAGHGSSLVELSLNIMKSLSQTTSWNKEWATQYPLHVAISRKASSFTRLAEPYKMKEIATPRDPMVNYSLVTHTDAFDITAIGGIVFVANKSRALKSKPNTFNITIKVTLPNETKTVMLRVDVIDDADETCKTQKRCFKQERVEDCENQCGYGTGKGSPVSPDGVIEPRSLKCVWRGNRTPPKEEKERLDINYSTCTHDIKSCPDFFCDPLEQLFHRICPQDCTYEVNGGNSNNGIGILSASTKSVCICHDSGICACAPPHNGSGKIEGKKHKDNNGERAATVPAYANTNANANTSYALTQLPRDPNVSAERATNEGSCGPECLIGVVVGSLFILTSITGIFLCWKYRMSGKGRRDRKYVGSVASLSGVQSDYIDRTLQSADALHLTYDPAAPIASPDPRTVPDPKWEFPRTRLIIEQTLGEGEFGRVLRARALDIGALSGCTTVAVKTLKENANAGELNDLLSEYQLLKEVTHPNVIRLLGACTTPGAPVYLIIEFAEFGSLRNYLRQSRHLESEGPIPCSFDSTPTAARSSTPEPEHVTTPATPRDILSFAWQISKGMEYLSDIKLVHRDLAARNVLLAAGKICKISDFGLTRDVYEDDAYLKRSKGRVPVKWMALESLADHMYTSKSDVWSFGVLMWELVTLGASPYPGVAVHNLFHLLKAGYRMEKPENCSAQLYNVMRSCWYETPCARPSFKELTDIFERMLEDGVEYLDLNPRIVHNRTYFSSPRDLLAKQEEERWNLNKSPSAFLIQQNLRDRQKSSTSSQFDSSSEDPHLQQQTPEDEQSLLSNHRCESMLIAAGPSKTSETQKHLYQNEMSEHNESPRPSNAYLTPIRQPTSANDSVDDSRTSPVAAKSVRPQSYLNMDGNVTISDKDYPDTQQQQDLLFFASDNLSNSSPNTSNVTYF